MNTLKRILYNRDPFGYKDGLFAPTPATKVIHDNEFGNFHLKRKNENSTYKVFPYRKSLQALYLDYNPDNIPILEYIKTSEYAPSISNDKNSKYYTFTGLSDSKKPLQYFAARSGGYRNKELHMVVSKGRDELGDYASYYDLWDFDSYKPILKINKLLNTDVEKKLGFNPVELYDRVYYDDYYNVPQENRGGIYIPEVIVTPDKTKIKDTLIEFNNGGRLNYLNFFNKINGLIPSLVKQFNPNSKWGAVQRPTEKTQEIFAVHEKGGTMNYLQYIN